MESRIEKPIFMVGAGRSGTTILYEVLAWHKDLAWISNYSDRYYRHFPFSAIACKLYRSGIANRVLGKRSPKPVEGYKLWDWCHPVYNSPADPPLTDKDVTKEINYRYQRVVYDHLKFSQKKRFLNKNTRNSRRIRYLNKIFPDALFIHIIRDGRAVAASLLNFKRWWRLRHNIWFMLENGIDPSAFNKRNQAELAVELWKAEVSKILEDKEALDGNRYHEVKYEDFVQEPIATMKNLCNFCKLVWSDNFERVIRNYDLRNMNYLYRIRLTKEQIYQVSTLAKDVANKLGYQLDNL